MAEAINARWAWEPYRPTAESPWDLKKVGHLYRRAGFGATWTDLQAGLKAGPNQAIEQLLQGGPGQDQLDRYTGEMAQSIRKANNGLQARAWWLLRMLDTPQPLHEKLALFWHNHFATSNAKVNNAGYMIGQYELMRKHALGNFRSLLQEMSKDPAMLIWLDTSLSKKAMPNENYAREVMELFSLGVGNYTEKDIREAARAFTGWEIKDGSAVFNPAQHDDSAKTVLGRTGNWKGEDIVNICLEQKSCPYFIAGKLFRYLVSETVPATPELLEPLATQFRKSDWNFGGLVKTVLRSNLFFSPAAYRTRIKPPVDFALGIIRALEGRIGTTALVPLLQDLGQDIFYPPSVKGWDGGPAWLNGQTLLSRQNLALALTSTEDARFVRRNKDSELALDPARLARDHGRQSDAEIVDFFLHLFLQGDVASETRTKLVKYLEHARKEKAPVYYTDEDKLKRPVRAVCHLVLTLPEFQLD